jgi:1,4-alpha-glucan branching enzyme
MGTELAQEREWNHDTSLDWHLAEDPARAAFARFLADLGGLYRARPCLWRRDHEPEGFRWIDCADRDHSVIAYTRHDGPDELAIVLNLTPVPRSDYRIGVSRGGAHRVILSSDDPAYGGSGAGSAGALVAEDHAFHDRPASLRLTLPPLGAVILAPGD